MQKKGWQYNQLWLLSQHQNEVPRSSVVVVVVVVVVVCLLLLLLLLWAGIAQLVLRLAMCWMVGGSYPRGGEISGTRPGRNWGPPSLLYNGYQVSFRWVK